MESPTRYSADFFREIQEIFVALIHEFGRSGIWLPIWKTEVK